MSGWSSSADGLSPQRAIGLGPTVGQVEAGPLGEEVHAAHVVALLALPGMGPARLGRLLSRHGSAERAWQQVAAGVSEAVFGQLGRRGDPVALAAAWQAAAAGVDPRARWQAHRAAGVVVLAKGGYGYPDRLVGDLEPPELLFAQGDIGLLGHPTVALVGTRRASAYGLRLARSWGDALASAGVVVVSGLAAGIDAAAHQGALDGLERSGCTPGPVAVVGTGHDVCYPASSRALWRRVADVGLILSEAPLGTRPEPWRFPARNRIIAALADVVVVVESHERGGSLSTAEEAAARNRVVLAVPGSVYSPASVGTHRLIAEGAGVAVSIEDVLLALGSRRPGSTPQPLPPTAPLGDAVRSGAGPMAEQERNLLDALGWEPTTLDDLVLRTAWSLDTVCAVLNQLQRLNLVTQAGIWLTQRGD